MSVRNSLEELDRARRQTLRFCCGQTQVLEDRADYQRALEARDELHLPTQRSLLSISIPAPTFTESRPVECQRQLPQVSRMDIGEADPSHS
jgi:hypothetical protein